MPNVVFVSAGLLMGLLFSLINDLISERKKWARVSSAVKKDAGGTIPIYGRKMVMLSRIVVVAACLCAVGLAAWQGDTLVILVLSAFVSFVFSSVAAGMLRMALDGADIDPK